MNDIVNMRLSRRATETADLLVNTGKFADKITAAKFALGYAIKNYYDSFNPGDYNVEDNEGANYNIGTVDADGKLVELIRALYPNTETPFIYIRALMVYGLSKIQEKIDNEGMPNISSLCE